MNTNKRKTGRLLAGLLAAAGVLTVMPFSSLKASARMEQTLLGYYGDVNLDLLVDRVDVEELQFYLLAQPCALTEESVEYADLDDNNVLDANDLTLLKRILLEKKDPLPRYQEIEVPDEKQLIYPPVRAVEPTLGSVGEQKILMVSVEFPEDRKSVV